MAPARTVLGRMTATRQHIWRSRQDGSTRLQVQMYNTVFEKRALGALTGVGGERDGLGDEHAFGGAVVDSASEPPGAREAVRVAGHLVAHEHILDEPTRRQPGVVVSDAQCAQHAEVPMLKVRYHSMHSNVQYMHKHLSNTTVQHC